MKNVGKVKYDDFPTALATTADGESVSIAKKGRLLTIQYEPDGGYGTPAVFAMK